MADGERARAFLRPQRIGARQLRACGAGAGPAELGIERVGAAGRRQQLDRRRLRVDGLVELRQRDVVDAAALERDRAFDAGGAGSGCAARPSAPGRGSRARRPPACARLAGRLRRRRAARAGAWRRARRRLGGLARAARAAALLMLLRLLLLLLRLLLRHPHKILPRDQHDSRQHDGENGVLVGHRDPFCRRAPHVGAATRRQSPAPCGRTAISAPRAGRLAHNRDRSRQVCRRKAAPLPASGAEPGCARPHCRPSSTR